MKKNNVKLNKIQLSEKELSDLGINDNETYHKTGKLFKEDSLDSGKPKKKKIKKKIPIESPMHKKKLKKKYSAKGKSLETVLTHGDYNELSSANKKVIRGQIEEIDELIESFCCHVDSSENYNKYFVCERWCNILHVVKKVDLHVKEFNYNSVFQPYEKSDDRSYVISFFIKVIPISVDEDFLNKNMNLYFAVGEKFSAESTYNEYRFDYFFERLRNVLGCPVYIIRRKEDIERILEGVK